MKVALVYDRVNKFGGAERVLLALHQLWPKAPLFTSVYQPKRASWAKDFPVISSFLNRFPFARQHHEFFPMLMPLAFESFSFEEYDLVISVTSEFAKGIITKPETLHLCYCLTPARYLWSGFGDYFSSTVLRIASRPLISYLRSWDKLASQRPDEFLTISQTVKERIQKYYRRQATVIYPGVETSLFRPAPQKKRGAYFLIVSRLVQYKRIELAIRVFNQLGWPLKIIGQGMSKAALKRIARSNIEFIDHHLTDRELVLYYQNCRALIFAGTEDLGLAAIEAQACGKPVIAFREGGVAETIKAGKTGMLFGPKTVAGLKRALSQFKEEQYSAQACREQAEKFDVKIFKRKFKKHVEERYAFFRRHFVRRWREKALAAFAS